jgi:hypothetical protein
VTPVFVADVRRGQLLLPDQAFFDRWLRRLEGKVVEVVVRERPERRTLKQNAYYHAVCNMIADEIGDTPKDVHRDLKARFLPMGITSTRKLTKRQFAAYLEYVIWFAEHWLNMVIPPPNRVLEAIEGSVQPELVSAPRRAKRAAA